MPSGGCVGRGQGSIGPRQKKHRIGGRLPGAHLPQHLVVGKAVAGGPSGHLPRREGGVFYGRVFARIPGDWLKTSSGKNTLTSMYPQWKIPRARPLSSTRSCWKRRPLNSRREISCGWHPRFQAPLGRWDLRRLS